MNIHPLFVHLPIAFLSIYAMMEMVRFRFITSLPYWFYIKAFLVIAGTVGAAAALKTGEAAEELLERNNDIHTLIEIHSKWAKGTSMVFGLIAALYILAWISRLGITNHIEDIMGLKNIWAYIMLKKVINYFVGSFVMMLPALAGLVGIIVTGALGGAIVYGSNADPFIKVIYSLFLKKI